MDQAGGGRTRQAGNEKNSTGFPERSYTLTFCYDTDKCLLRMGIVNFRTSVADIEALPELIVKTGRHVHAHMRPDNMKSP
jgi:hypothetical protein